MQVRRDDPAGQRRALTVAFVANALLLVAELVGGVVFGSLALLADGVHLVSDVLALAVAWVALAVAARPPSRRHTYGLGRAEVLAAQLNAFALLGASAWIVYEAVHRFGASATIDGGGVLAVAATGLFVNLISAWGIGRRAGRSLNLRAAFWHLAGDALGSVAAIAAGIAVLVAGARWVDPTASIAVSVLVALSAVRLLADTSRVLLEAVPSGIDVDAVEAALVGAPGVEAVHHIHVWSLGSEAALSAHVVLEGAPSLHDAQVQGEGLKALLAQRFAITHTTLELECHGCAGPIHVVR